jgi:hypothetical protein
VERVQDRHRHQLLGEVEGPVVVRAVGDDDRQPIGLPPGADEVVRGRLGGRIGRARVVGRRLGEPPLGPQRAEHLVGRDVVQPEPLGPPLAQPEGPRGLQEVEGADHVGLHEGRGAVDGAVHVALGGQVHHRTRPMLGQGAVERRPIQQVRPHEAVERGVRDRRHVGEVPGIGQRVEVDDLVPPRHGEPHDRRPDEPRPAGHQELHRHSLRIEHAGPS